MNTDVLDSPTHLSIASSAAIRIVPLSTSPSFLQTSNRFLILLFAPVKALYQAFSLYYTLGYSSPPSEWILLQNPPSIPTFLIATFLAFVRNSKLIIDWHNFGYSLYAMKFGPTHPLVRLHEWYEFTFGKFAAVNFTVTEAMAGELNRRGIPGAVALHDRPAELFQPTTSIESRRKALRDIFPETEQQSLIEDIMSGKTRLLVSSTSWTPDEDFSILLDALVSYCSNFPSKSSNLPNIHVVITGKGPLLAHYTSLINQLITTNKLPKQIITIKTTFFPSLATYATLLSAADLGVSLHTSSSGLDLPMKVVDMFGAGLPVLGCTFEAWPELVTQGVDGMGFEAGKLGAEQLSGLLVKVFGKGGVELEELKKGALRQCARRWDDEWEAVAGRIIFKRKDQ
jgi:beta-1,4-mannosyltransferase